jgi:hypothetical protein
LWAPQENLAQESSKDNWTIHDFDIFQQIDGNHLQKLVKLVSISFDDNQKKTCEFVHVNAVQTAAYGTSEPFVDRYLCEKWKRAELECS